MEENVLWTRDLGLYIYRTKDLKTKRLKTMDQEL